MSDFLAAFDRTIQHEGGYINHPGDPGGETKYGISKRSYPNADIGALTVQQASTIYYNDYWLAPGLYRLRDNDLAAMVFDLGVVCGPSRAISWMQDALVTLERPVLTDGILGGKTASAANNYPHPKALRALIRYYAVRHFLRQNQPDFLAGWLARVDI